MELIEGEYVVDEAGIFKASPALFFYYKDRDRPRRTVASFVDVTLKEMEIMCKALNDALAAKEIKY